MKYKLLLFDLDETLLSFHGIEFACFEQALRSFHVQGDLRPHFLSYRQHSKGLWDQFEKGEIDKDYLRLERWGRTLQDHSLELDRDIVSQHYLKVLSDNGETLEGALELCEFIKPRYQVGIITNGYLEVQSARLKKSSLAPYIDFLVVSEDCGFAKPHPQIFQFAMKKAGVTNVEEVLMIGDRLETDILGAQNLKMPSCYYNPQKKIWDQKAYQPTYEIAHLKELIEILK